MNLKTVNEIKDHFAKCQHVDSVHSEVGGAKVIWCPSCGTLMSPHESFIKGIARRMKPPAMFIGSFGMMDQSNNINKVTVYGVTPAYAPHTLISIAPPTIIINGD